jgi:hypothetical protein
MQVRESPRAPTGVAGACGFTGDRGAGSSAAPTMIAALSERSVMPHRVQCWDMCAGLSVTGRRGMVGPHLRHAVAFKPDEPDQAAGRGARPAPDLADSSDKVILAKDGRDGEAEVRLSSPEPADRLPGGDRSLRRLCIAPVR